jgi:hypothetical protein
MLRELTEKNEIKAAHAAWNEKIHNCLLSEMMLNGSE